MLSEAMSSPADDVMDEAQIAGGKAGVHGEDRAGNAGGGVGGEKHHGVGDLFRRHQPAERIMRQDLIQDIRSPLQAVIPGGRPYRAWTDDVRPYPIAAALDGDRLGVG